MDNITNPNNLICVIVFLKYVFISFSFENNGLSAVAGETGTVKMIRRANERIEKELRAFF